MKKRAICLFLSALMLLSLAACGEKAEELPEETAPAEETVPESSEPEEEAKDPPPMILEGRLTEMPSYVLSEGATADEMRQTAIRAMRDGLSFPWYPEETIKYFKAGPGSGEAYEFDSDQIYCGLPYTLGDSSLLHWLQYYDFESGRFENSEISNINNKLGNACATSIMWAWNAVCNDQQWDECRYMTPQNGCIPVAGYEYPEEITTYRDTSTTKICNANSAQQMYAAYANVLPADAIFQYDDSTNKDHVVMAMDVPHVEYNDDGSINGKASYIPIMDQRYGSASGSNYQYDKTVDGVTYHSSGRIDFHFTFEALRQGGFIPVTCAQFMGEKPYEKATAALEADVSSFDELAQTKLRSNYNIVTIRVTVSDPKTGKTLGEHNYVRFFSAYLKSANKDKDKEYSLTYDFSNQNKTDPFLTGKDLVGNLSKGSDYRVKIDTLVASGETINVLDKVLTY